MKQIPLKSVYFEVSFLVSCIRVNPITDDRIVAEFIGENARNKDASSNSSANKIHRLRDDPHKSLSATRRKFMRISGFSPAKRTIQQLNIKWQNECTLRNLNRQ